MDSFLVERRWTLPASLSSIQIMEQITTEINKITAELDDIKKLLGKNYEDWTLKEKQMFGDHEQLREEKTLLLKQKTILMQREQNQGT